MTQREGGARPPAGGVDFRAHSVRELAAQVRSADRSATELVGAALARIEALDPSIGAFVAVDGERALEQAAAVDQLVAAGGDPGPLAGIPLAVKDLEDAAGYPTTHGSPLHRDPAPAVADSAQVARLRAAGCVVVGKTNTPEFGWTAHTANAVFGATNNPWDLDCSPGGSSGGSAAALAAGMVPLATGSDGGGSIRIPSSCCGLSGVKTSMGRVPMGGPEAPDWPDLSVRGPMARRVADVVAALDVVVGPEATDLRSLPRPEASWPAVLDHPNPPARIAWSPTLGYAPVDREVLSICERAVRVLESLGSEVVVLDTVFDEDPVDDWIVMTGAYLLRSLAPLRKLPGWDELHPNLGLMLRGAETLSAVDFLRSADRCHQLNVRLVELFHEVRLLVTPTLAGPPPPQSLGGSGLVNGERTANWVRFTYPFNMTRSPAATVCAGTTRSGLPVGLQLIGPSHADLVVLRSAAALEEALGWTELAPVE